jgi:hypothetical protein
MALDSGIPCRNDGVFTAGCNILSDQEMKSTLLNRMNARFRAAPKVKLKSDGVARSCPWQTLLPGASSTRKPILQMPDLCKHLPIGGLGQAQAVTDSRALRAQKRIGGQFLLQQRRHRGQALGA